MPENEYMAILKSKMAAGQISFRSEWHQIAYHYISYLRKDIDMLEKIQRRATKLIPELRDLRYEERLKECGLTTLETRR